MLSKCKWNNSKKKLLKGKHKELKGASISQEKAFQFKRQMEEENSELTGNGEWLDWLKNLNIWQIIINGEALSADKEAAIDERQTQ